MAFIANNFQQTGAYWGQVFHNLKIRVGNEIGDIPTFDKYNNLLTKETDGQGNYYKTFADLVNAMNSVTDNSYPKDFKQQKTYDLFIDIFKSFYTESQNLETRNIINAIKDGTLKNLLESSTNPGNPNPTVNTGATTAALLSSTAAPTPQAPEFGVGITAFNKNNLILRYPDDMPLTSKESDWVRFTFYEYSPPYNGKNTYQQYNNSINPTPTSYANNTGSSPREYRPGVYPAKLNGGITTFNRTGDNYPSIALYMPSGGQIIANYSSSWSNKSVSPLMSTALNLVGGTLDMIGQAEHGNAAVLLDTANTFATAIRDNTLGVLGVVGASAISTAINEISKDFGLGGGDMSGNDILSSITGTILNPNIEVLYQGPTLREFGLSFKMSARNSKESTTIRQICDTFKQASLPSTMTPVNNLQDYKNVPAFQKNLLSTPKIVEVTFMTGSSINKNVSQYKICAITHVNINYSPNGAWSTYSDGSPIGVDLSLSFKELKILHEGEYPYILDGTEDKGMY